MNRSRKKNPARTKIVKTRCKSEIRQNNVWRSRNQLRTSEMRSKVPIKPQKSWIKILWRVRTKQMPSKTKVFRKWGIKVMAKTKKNKCTKRNRSKKNTPIFPASVKRWLEVVEQKNWVQAQSNNKPSLKLQMNWSKKIEICRNKILKQKN